MNCVGQISIGEAEKGAIAELWRLTTTKHMEFGQARRTIYFETVPPGGVAQLGEHLPCKQGVRSSILLVSTNIFLYGPIAQLVRAHA